MSKSLIAIVVSLFAVALVPGAHGRDANAHTRDYWKRIASGGYVIPAGENAFALTRELSLHLGSPDPELRDDLAYSIIAVWIVKQKQLAPPELIALSDAWRANLRYRIGENGTDAVLKRSFSALCLEALAERDLSTPFLEETRYRALLDDTLTYLRSEKDLRAFDGRKGWIHATAHTADLLAALALNPSFRRSDQVLVLEAIAEKLASAGAVFTFGEQDRLANAIAKIAGRADFDVDEFRTWLARLNETDDAVWSHSPPRLPLLIRFENDTYMLRALALRMYSGPQISLVKEARTALLDILGRR